MLKVTIEYACSGCNAKTNGDTEIHRRFSGFSGRSYGFGSWEYSSVPDLIANSAPSGWVPFDPYTNVTYCQTCWSEIEPAAEKGEE